MKFLHVLFQRPKTTFKRNLVAAKRALSFDASVFDGKYKTVVAERNLKACRNPLRANFQLSFVKPKVITLAIHRRHRQSSGPIKNGNKYM